MDTPTQALLGATIGQVCAGSRLGRRAAWWGAAAGLLPDLDVVMIATHGPWGEFLYHRGPTHALWFGPVVGPMLGFAVWRWYARSRGGAESDPVYLRTWIWLFVLALFTHPLLDVFTVYGTQLLAPFSNHRFALNGVAIIDPVYSLCLIAALIIGRRYRTAPRVGMRAAAVALVLTSAYLFYGLWLNGRAEAEVRRQLAADGIVAADVRCYPTLLQVFLRRVVVRTEREVRVGMLSMWRPGPIHWRSFTPDHHPLVDELRRTREGEIFVWFAMGQVAPRVIQHADGFVVELDDIRYGFPGPPDEGIWGIRAEFDADGRLRGGVQRFDRPRPASVGMLLRQLWRGTFRGAP